MKRTIKFFSYLSFFLVLTTLTVNALSDSSLLDVPLLGTDDGCWGSSMHMILNYYSDDEIPFYKEVAYQGGTRFEIRRQLIGGRVDETGELNVLEQDIDPKLIEPWTIQPEDMQHLAYDLGYTYHHAYLKSSYRYNFPSIQEQEAGEENIIHFSDKNEVFLFLKELIDEETPVIVGLPGHFVVLTGYDNKNVFINNPTKPTIAIKQSYTTENFLEDSMWAGPGCFMQWFSKTHKGKNIDDIMWMLKEAAKRAHKNINYYAQLTANGTIIDDYTDPVSGNNVNHLQALEKIARYREHIFDFLDSQGYEEIAEKYKESATKFTEASTLPQKQRSAVLKQIAEIEEEAYDLFVKELPELVVELNEPSEIKGTSMKISWSPYAKNDFVNYDIYVSWLPGVLGKKVKTITDKSITSTTIENLERSRTYSITIKVNKQQGYGYSNQVTAQTSKMAYITSLKLKEKGSNVILIDWTESLRDDVLRYETYISTKPSFEPTEEKLATRSSDPGLTESLCEVQNPGTYYFKLRTVYKDNTFSDSEETSITVGKITKRFVGTPEMG